MMRGGDEVWFCPSINWAQGGPIIERERIAVWGGCRNQWYATHPNTIPSGYNGQDIYIDVGDEDSQDGATPLIAAMRAHIASKYGDEVSDEPSK